MINKNFLKRVLAGSGLIAVMAVLSPAQALEAGDQVYVDDELRVGVRADASNRLRPHAVVTTGALLEVLEQKGDYIRIRTQDGEEGWIKHTYTSTKPPAVIQLRQLQEEYKQLQAQLDKAPSAAGDNTAKLQQLTRQNRELQASLDKQQQTIQQLQSRLMQNDASAPEREPASPTSVPANSASSLPALLWAGLAVLLALAGFFVGAAWHRRLMMKKLGGFSL